MIVELPSLNSLKIKKQSNGNFRIEFIENSGEDLIHKPRKGGKRINGTI